MERRNVMWIAPEGLEAPPLPGMEVESFPTIMEAMKRWSSQPYLLALVAWEGGEGEMLIRSLSGSGGARGVVAVSDAEGEDAERLFRLGADQVLSLEELEGAGGVRLLDRLLRRKRVEMERSGEGGAPFRSLLFREAVEQGPLSIMITDGFGTIRYVNAKQVETTGFSREEMLGNNPRIFRERAMPPEFYHGMWETITSGKSWQGLIRNRRKSGEEYWEETSISPIMNPLGEVTHYMAVKNDVTGRVEAEEKLKASERKFREEHDRLQTVLDTVPAYISWFDADCTYQGGNRLLARMLGCKPEEIAGRPLGYRVAESPFVDFVRRAMEGEAEEQSLELKVDYLGKDEWHFLTSRKYGNEGNLMVVGMDVTSLKKAEEEIREKDQMLSFQARLAAMGEMIGNIAHQWRQPLNSLAMLVQNLRLEYDAGQLDGERINYAVSKQMELIRAMSNTIDDFRFFFRRAGEQKMFGLNESVKKAISLLEPRLESHRVRVELDEAEQVGVVGHQSEFCQVVLILLNNAVDAFVERHIGGPRVRMAIRLERGKALLTVEDNAGGIPKEIRERIFDPYFTTKEEGKGTGIGLYMARTIVEKNMGGAVELKPMEGGSRFVLSLPADVTL